MSEQVYRLPLIGEKAPSFTAPSTHGTINFPDDYKGKWVVFFSHPADFTPVCTTEFVAFAKRLEEFKKLNTELVGLSVDQVFSHIKWVEWIEEKLGEKIPFPIVADNTGEIARKYGMLHEQGPATVRAVFIIDPEGIIRTILYYPMELGRNMDEILRIIRALQVHQAHKVAIPANWPNNELIGDRVIVPPPQSRQEAEERLKRKDIECYDWWFCHKKVEY